jgi:hypothetical protein
LIEEACALKRVAEDRKQERKVRDGEIGRGSGPAAGPGLGEEGGHVGMAVADWRSMLAVQGIAPGGDDSVMPHFAVSPGNW